jgi:PAS domain S-box-containing protein
MSSTGDDSGLKPQGPDGTSEFARQEALLKMGALQDAIFNSANFSSIATDAKGVIQIFNVGAERMLGYKAAEVLNKITPADISDPQELIARAKALSVELGTKITPGFEALVFKASRGIEDIYELSYIRKDGSRFPAVVSVTALRAADEAIIGYLLIGTDNTDRQQASERQRAASQYVRSLIEASLDPLVTISAEGKITDVNEGSIKVTGVPREKLIGTDFSDYFTEPERAREGYLEVFSKGSVTDYPLTIRHADGRLTDVLYNASVYRDLQGNVLGVFAAARDVTARKQAEAALLKAGALQNAIFNSANFSSIATDAKGVIQIFNVGAERMLGYTAAEVMNKITPADISDPQELIERARLLSLELDTAITPGFEALVFKASRGIEDIYELTYVRKDESRFPAIVSVTALRDVQDAIIGYLLIGTDNTARKQVEAAQALLDQRLRDQQFYTRSLIESNIDALMTTDPQGIISDVNQQMISLTGRTRDELIGAHCKNFFTDPGRADAAIKRVLSENKVSNYELTVRALDGEETVVSYNAATFHDRDRKLQGVFAAARDVTERKRFERALQEKNIELEHASRMKSEFLATMSHELRTPLNAIIGFSEALKDGLVGEMSEKQCEYMGDIFTSGQHLLSLINDILDLSKVEAGMMALELEEVDLLSLLSNSLSIVKEKAATQRIQLELDISEGLGLSQLDTRKTKQIVYNLLSNAVKFSGSGSGSRVKLRARHVTRASVGTLAGSWSVHSFPLASNEYSEFLEICVSDNGIGIAKQNMSKLFQAFSQIDSSLSRKFEGTGLGLAMVKQLAELHGGTVAVASGDGEGSCFAVWLPLRTSAQALLTAPTGANVTSLYTTLASERTVLLLEGDDSMADLIRRLLAAEGFSLLRATSAEEALVLAPLQRLSLIILDMQLPDAEGQEFLRQIHKQSGLAQVPLVLIAGLLERNLALPDGAAVLQVPIGSSELRAALKRLGLQPDAKHRHKLLIVDDDPQAVEVIAALLPAASYLLVRAYGGREAIGLAQQLQPDLILLDLLMPDISGFDVVQALHCDASTTNIPILVVTNKQVTVQERAMLNGDSAQSIQIVEKPGLNQEQFLAEVRRALSPH